MFFFIGLSLYGTSIPRKYSIFIQQLSLFYFRKIFLKKPWDLEPCRETVRNDKKSGDSRQNRESWQVSNLEGYTSLSLTVKAYPKASIADKKFLSQFLGIETMHSWNGRQHVEQLSHHQ